MNASKLMRLRARLARAQSHLEENAPNNPMDKHHDASERARWQATKRVVEVVDELIMMLEERADYL